MKVASFPVGKKNFFILGGSMSTLSSAAADFSVGFGFPRDSLMGTTTFAGGEGSDSEEMDSSLSVCDTW
jgi:hypothetical protein